MLRVMAGASAVLLVMVSLGAFAALPQDGATFALENNVVKLLFERQGDGVALTSIQRLPDGKLLSMEPFSADWRISLKTRDHPKAELSLSMSRKAVERANVEDGAQQAGGHIFFTTWSEQEDREAVDSPHWDGSITLNNVTRTVDTLTCVWHGQGRIYDEYCDFVVTTNWTLAPGDFKAHTNIDVQVLPHGDEKKSPLYLSAADYPLHRIQPVGDNDYIAIPYIGGYLFEKPCTNPIAFIGNDPGAMSMPVYAYYDADSGDCLYLCNTDTDGNFKLDDIHTQNGYLMYRVRQIPPDIFESRHYKQPYDDVVGVLDGDWMTAAETYQSFLASETDWYKGPVGAETNPMPQPAKDTMVVATHQMAMHGTEYEKESGITHEEFLAGKADPALARDGWVETTDALGKDHKRAAKYFDCPIFSTWYGGYYEGAISGEHGETGISTFYSKDESERANDLIKPIKKAQRGTKNIVAPYINAQLAYYYPTDETTDGPYTARNYGAAASCMIQEDGHPVVMEYNNSGMMCPADAWWSEHLPNVLLDHYKRWGNRGVYLDYFMNFGTCYAEHHNHKPGGGDFMMKAKLYQMKRIRELLANEGMTDFAIAMESVAGRYTEECNLGYRHIFDHWGATSHSVAIPYYEWVFDNEKQYRVTNHGCLSDEEESGLWTWKVSTEVFMFGHVISTGNGAVNWQKYFGLPEGELYYQQVQRIARMLSSEGFKRFHTGSLARVPETAVSPEGNFHVLVDFPINVSGKEEHVYYDTSSEGTRTYAKPYILTMLPRGMFKSPDGDLAFVLTNPWVGPNPFSDEDTVTFKAVFDPMLYRGFPERYRLSMTYADGETTDLGVKTGATTLTGAISPGEIIYWTMDQL